MLTFWKVVKQGILIRRIESKVVPESLLHSCKRSTIKHGASKIYVEYLRYPEDGLFIFNLIRAGYRLGLMVNQNQGRLPLMLMRSKSSMLRVK